MFFAASRLPLQVRPNDLDILGHVNNAVVLEYLEAGRWDWLGKQGLVHTDRVIAVVARAEIDYRAEIRRGEIEVHTLLESPTEDEYEDGAFVFRACFRQRIHVPHTEAPAVEALITVAFLGTEERCLVSMQDFVTAGTPRPVL